MKALPLAFAALLASSVASLATEYPVTVTDLTGQKVTVKSEPERIILEDGRDILTMSLLDRKNPFKRVVGWSTNFLRSDPSTVKLMQQKFGDKLPADISAADSGNIDTESILAPRPDLVISQLRAKKSLEENGVAARLKELGIPLLYVDVMENPIKDTRESVSLIGKVINREKEADDYVSFYDAHWKHLQDVISKQKHHPAALVEAKAGNKDDSCCYAHGNMGFGKLLTALGAHNIPSDLLPGATGTVSIEALLTDHQPDVFIMSGSQWTNPGNGAAPFGYNTTPEKIDAALLRLEQRTGVKELKAVKEGHAYGLYHQFYNHPWNIVGLEYLATFLYPDAFADLDPAETYSTLIKDYTEIPEAPFVLGRHAPQLTN